MVATFSTDTGQGRSNPGTKLRVAEPSRPSWARLIEGRAAGGLPAPVAVVVSIADDWLTHDHFGEAASFELDDAGRARSSAPKLDEVTAWLAAALGAEQGWLPASAHALFDRLADAADLDPPTLRSWLKETFGAPAPREEVAAWMRSSSRPEPTSISAVSIAPSVPVLAVDLAAPTADLEPLLEPSLVPEPIARSAPPRPASLPPLAVDLAAPTADLDQEQIASEDLPTLRPAPITDETEADELLPIPEPVVDEADIPTDPPIRARTAAPKIAPTAMPTADVSSEDRAVVRHVAPRDRPIALAMAPAARKSAQPVIGGESIILPAERRGSPWWLLLLALVAGAVYALFFR